MIPLARIRARFATMLILAACVAVCNGKAGAQNTASISLLPSETPSASEHVVARITYTMATCGSFAAPTPLAQPGGVFEVRIIPVRTGIDPPCVVTFDVFLGLLPQGVYSVHFHDSGFSSPPLATTSFTVGAVPVPAIGPAGIALLAMIVGFVAILVGRRTDTHES